MEPLVGSKEPFENHLIILGREDTLDYIKGLKDNYYDSFTDLDFKARNVESLEDYLRLLSETSGPSNEHRDLIRRCVYEIDSDEELWSKIGNHDWINVARLRAIPWKIGLTPVTYEFGLPHTRGDAIFMPELKEGSIEVLKDTLLHEKLHVYQKMYPDDFKRYLNSEGFVRYCKRRDVINVAANPDADEWVYMRDAQIFVGKYSKGSSRRRTVSYTPINNPRYDCPQEYAVYNLLRTNP